MTTLDTNLAARAASDDDRIALRCGQETTTYGQLHAYSERLAGALVALGAGPHSRVGFLGRDSPRLIALLHACARVGAVLVPIGRRLTAGEVAHVLRDSEPVALFTDADSAAVARTAVKLAEAGTEIIEGEPPPGPAARPRDRDTDPGDAVVQLYTSGTTGRPKGAVLSHRTFFAVRDVLAAAGEDWLGFRATDVSLACGPAWHVGGLWWIVQGLTAGAVTVLLPEVSPPTALRAIREHAVTITCMPPAMLGMLLAEPDRADGDLASVRKVVYGGSPISETLLRRGIEAMDCEFAQIYGLTETGNTAVCLPPEAHRRGGALLRAAGRPYPGFAVKIVNEAGVELPAGEVGEICLWTPARMLGYWRLPEETRATLSDGWIRTGDLGHLDAEGYVYIRDRLKDLIIRAGENIYPAEVENAVTAHPAVADAAVIGVPDERWGEAVLALVVFHDGQRATPRELRHHLREHLADYKIPQAFETVDTIPRNAIGKILRRTLRAPRWDDHDRKVN